MLEEFGRGSSFTSLVLLGEKVLSREIFRLADLGHLRRMLGPRAVALPTHAFFADDLMVFN